MRNNRYELDLLKLVICVGLVLGADNVSGQIKSTSTQTKEISFGRKEITTYRSYENGDESKESVFLDRKGGVTAKISQTYKASGEISRTEEHFNQNGMAESRSESDQNSAGKITRSLSETYQDGILASGIIHETVNGGREVIKKYNPATEQYEQAKNPTLDRSDSEPDLSPNDLKPFPTKDKLDKRLIGRWRSEPGKYDTVASNGMDMYDNGGLVFIVSSDGNATFDYGELKETVKRIRYGGMTNDIVTTTKATGKATAVIATRDDLIELRSVPTLNVTVKQTSTNETEPLENKLSDFFPGNRGGANYTSSGNILILGTIKFKKAE